MTEKTQADATIAEMFSCLESLNDRLEIDDYRSIFALTKALKAHIQNIEDSCLEYLTAYQNEENQPDRVLGGKGE
jgi:hypothetical protein